MFDTKSADGCTIIALGYIYLFFFFFEYVNLIGP